MCENVAAAGVFCRVVVACDSARVAQAVTAAGFEAMLTAPALPSGTDRVAAAAAQLSLEPAQLVVNVQGDEPFVSRQALAALVDAFGKTVRPSPTGLPATEILRALAAQLKERQLATRTSPPSSNR